MKPEPLAMVDLLRRAAEVLARTDTLSARSWLADWTAMLATIDGPGARWVLVDGDDASE